MRTLDLKLVRELRRHWAQVLSIALVLSCGTMTIMGLRGTLTSVRAARDRYFEEYRFGDVFAHVQRAPVSIAKALETISGVAAVETRIIRDVRIDLPGVADLATGHMVSLPALGRPAINNLHLRTGRWITPGRRDEVIISDRFAELNGLKPGDSLAAVLNGRRERFRVVGVALSPEFVVESAGGFFVDNSRYGIVWTSRAVLETAFDMNGAFNDVVIRLSPGISADLVIDEVNRVLDPWGAADAYDRSDQPAARVLSNEFSQLETNATVFPMFFLIVSAFLLNVVLLRLVASQRDEIAALKAFGYTNVEVGAHYLGFGVAAVAIGAAVGLPLGIWMGARFTAMYAEYFRFPSLPALVDWNAVAVAIGVSGSFALLGAINAVRRVVALTPAQALLPESPGRFRPLLLDRLGIGHRVPPDIRMVLRNIERRPIRTASTVIGVGLAVALLAAGRFPYDAFDRLFDVEFRLVQRYGVAVGFTGARPASSAAAELRRIEGVLSAEPFRSTPVRLSAGPESRTTTITGLDAGGTLYGLVDFEGSAFVPPSDGVVVTQGLARVLGIVAGDTVHAELIERSNDPARVPVVGVYDPMLGQGLFTTRAYLNRLLREGDVASGAYLAVAPGRDDDVSAALKELPAVVAATSRRATMDMIDEQIRESMAFTLTLIISSACVIAIGVVYNSARIALSERGRELASLRVLGFTTNEVTGMLLGEQVAMLVLALPAGIAIGAGFSYALSHAFETDNFHFPFVVALRSQLFAMGVVVAAAAAASLVDRRRVKRLDMVSALRTRE